VQRSNHDHQVTGVPPAGLSLMEHSNNPLAYKSTFLHGTPALDFVSTFRLPRLSNSGNHQFNSFKASKPKKIITTITSTHHKNEFHQKITRIPYMLPWIAVGTIG